MARRRSHRTREVPAVRAAHGSSTRCNDTARAHCCVTFKPAVAGVQNWFNILCFEHVYSGSDQAGDLRVMEQHLLQADSLR